MGNRIYHITTLILLLFCSCGKVKEDCTDKGAYAQVMRSVDAFHSISVGDRIDVELVSDSSKKGQIELQGFGNLFSGIRSEVKDGILTFSDHNRCKWLRELDARLRVVVYVDEKLEFLYVMDDASIISKDTLRFEFLQMDHRSSHNQYLLLDGTRFWVEHYAGGELSLNGKTGVIKITNFETGAVDGRNLLCDDAFIHHYGLNKIHVKASHILSCQFENKGDVFYYVEPVNQPEILGSGEGQLLRAF